MTERELLRLYSTDYGHGRDIAFTATVRGDGKKLVVTGEYRYGGEPVRPFRRTYDRYRVIGGPLNGDRAAIKEAGEKYVFFNASDSRSYAEKGVLIHRSELEG